MKIVTSLQHIAIIMDGNGRWAKKRNLPRVEGHRRGAKVAESAIDWAKELKIPFLTLYTFSTENWKRPEHEVNFLFSLLERRIKQKKAELVKKGVKVLFAGRLDKLPKGLREACKDLMEATKNNKDITVISALNYGGRAEIVDAVKRMIRDRITSVDEETFRRYLYYPEVPDPDLVIRTAGEFRVSNFLLWEIAYSEFLILDKEWPDFTKEDLINAIKWFNKRERRFGGIET